MKRDKKLKYLFAGMINLIFSYLNAGYCFSQKFDFRHFGIQQGLNSMTINHIMQDSRGAIWLACQDGGIYKYSGRQFINYTTKDGLSGMDATCTAEDSSGNIWISTATGISLFDGVKFKTWKSGNEIPNGTVFSMVPWGKFGVLASIRGKGIFHFDGKEWKPFLLRNKLPNNQIYCLLKSKDNTVWVELEEGEVGYIKNNLFVSIKIPDNLSKHTFFSGYIDKENTVWMGTSRGGFIKIKNNVAEQINLPDLFAGDFIGGITADLSGKIWIATLHGLLSYEKGKFNIVNEKNGLNTNSIQCVTRDKEGNIWLGTESAGLSAFYPENLYFYTNENGLSANGINALAGLNNGDILIATNFGGLDLFNGKYFEKIKDPLIDQERILSLFISSSNELWIGTRNSGVFTGKISNKRIQSIKQFDKIPRDSIISVCRFFEDKNQNIWVGTYGTGVFKISPAKEIVHFEPSRKNGISSGNITAITQTLDGNIWVTSSDSGLHLLKGNTFVSVKNEALKNLKGAWAITTDKYNRIILCDRYKGVYLYSHPNKSVFYSVENGLISDIVKAVYYDFLQDNFWFSGVQGINVISIDKNYKITSNKFVEAERIGGYAEPSTHGFEKSENTLWLGLTASGLVGWNLNQPIVEKKIGEVKITELLLFNKKPDWKLYTDSINSWTNLPINPKFNYSQNQLQFRFSSTGLNRSVKYQFKLEGYDNQWSTPTYNTEAFYNQLPPGKFNFEVRVVSIDGKFGNNSSFEFEIKTPFWMTFWFYFLVITVIVLIVWFYIIFREKNLREKKKELEETVEKRTEQLKVAFKKTEEANSELKEKNLLITEKKIEVEKKQDEIMESISYALRIQKSILPPPSLIQKLLPKAEIFYQPKSIVSGDFYWIQSSEDSVLFAIADCTGHGVPGAMVSLFGYNSLNKCVDDFNLLNPSEILEKLNKLMFQSINHFDSDELLNDGMDICLCRWIPSQSKLLFAGANRPIYHISKGVLSEFKGNKIGIGGYDKEFNSVEVFSDHSINIKSGDKIVLFSDGYADQFGNNNKKYLSRKFRSFVEDNSHLDVKSLINLVKNQFHNWKGTQEQTDDVLVFIVEF